MFGQPTCKICGYSYMIGRQEDEKRHSCFHDEAENGLPSDLEDGVYFVSLKSPQHFQVIAREIFMEGSRETQYEFSLFEAGEQSTNDPVAAIHILNGRAIAAVLTRLESCDQRACLADFRPNAMEGSWLPSCGEGIKRHDRRTVEFIWVHKKHRGQDILDVSLHEIERHFGLPLS